VTKQPSESRSSPKFGELSAKFVEEAVKFEELNAKFGEETVKFGELTGEIDRLVPKTSI
jgi:hypothetical protein